MEMISESDVQEMLESPDLLAIGARADDVRRTLHGARTTFVRVFEMHVESLPGSVPRGTSAGEFRVVGRPASLELATVAVGAAVKLADGIPVTGFSLADLLALDGRSSLASVCRALREAGLEAIAEAPLDLLESPAEAIAAARGAGLLVPRLTVHELRQSERIALLNRARDLQETVGGIRVFAPLPRAASVTAPSTGYDDVKQIALARVVVENIDSIQVDWTLYGPKLAQFALTTGANDVDGVAAIDPGTLGTRRSPIEEIRGNIRSAALEPIERNARFEAIG
jgi:aminodeoxyfutalosine synthase